MQPRFDVVNIAMVYLLAMVIIALRFSRGPAIATSILSASSSLVEGGERLGAEARNALAQSIFDQAREMSEHVAKILQMTRLETGAIKVDRDWAAIGEIAGSVLARLDQRMSAHRAIVELPDDLPLVRVDAGLIEQALGNLLENSAKHTAPGGSDVGLGLAIFRAIVRLHGRQAWAESMPAGGTAFHFTLPLETPPTAPAEMEAA